MATDAFQLAADPLPLSRDSAGVIRIAGTRVSLDSIVAWYEKGMSVPELAEGFPDLSLADIHTAIAFFLRHQEEVGRYLEGRRLQAREVRESVRAEYPEVYREFRPSGGRDRRNAPRP